MKYVIAGALAPFFWLLVLGLALWLVRRLFPRAESWLFAPLGVTVRRAAQHLRSRRRPPAA